jgi:tetratricopeptide (TPR) repeat protein
LESYEQHPEPRQGSCLKSGLTLVAIASVLLLFIFHFSQRSAIRELRAMVLSDRADALILAGDGNGAEALLLDAEDLDSSTPRVQRRLAVARMMAGRHLEAIEAAKEHLRQERNDVGTMALLGAAQILSQDFNGAEQTLTTALVVAPLNRDLVQNLSELRRTQKRPGEAAALIDQYLSRNPGDGFFTYKRAMADVAGELPQERREAVAATIKSGNATAPDFVLAAAIDFRDGRPDLGLEKLRQANQRATSQEMQTLLEDEFFQAYLQVTPSSATPAKPAAAAP